MMHLLVALAVMHSAASGAMSPPTVAPRVEVLVTDDVAASLSAAELIKALRLYLDAGDVSGIQLPRQEGDEGSIGTADVEAARARGADVAVWIARTADSRLRIAAQELRSGADNAVSFVIATPPQPTRDFYRLLALRLRSLMRTLERATEQAETKATDVGNVDAAESSEDVAAGPRRVPWRYAAGAGGGGVLNQPKLDPLPTFGGTLSVGRGVWDAVLLVGHTPKWRRATTEGAGRVQATRVQAALRLSLPRYVDAGPWTPSLELGGGILWAQARGRLTGDEHARRDHIVVPSATTAMVVGYRLGTSLGLVLRLAVDVYPARGQVYLHETRLFTTGLANPRAELMMRWGFSRP